MTEVRSPPKSKLQTNELTGVAYKNVGEELVTRECMFQWQLITENPTLNRQLTETSLCNFLNDL